MSIHGNLRGKSWSLWKEALGSASPTGSDSRGSTRSDSPAPDDVMKLTREDMNMFGRCPAWDTFLLVICDKCRNSVKIEAFESHLTLRHGTKSERNAYHKVMAAKAAESLKTCHVKLTPVKSSQEMRQSPDLNDIVVVSSGSSSSTSPLPPYSRNPPSSSIQRQPADSASAPESRCSSPMDIPMVSQPVDETMEVDPEPEEDTNDVEMSEPSSSSSAPTAPSSDMNYVTEEVSSTTNNVISIPDTDDIPNIEIGIISEGEGLNAINTKFNVALLKNDPPVDSTTVTASKEVVSYSPAATTPVITASADLPTDSLVTVTVGNNMAMASQVNITSSPATTGHPVMVTTSSSPAGYITVAHAPATTPEAANMGSPQQRIQIVREGRMESVEQQPTQYITVSPLAKSSPKKVICKGREEMKKNSGREREYHPDRHCGVWDAEAKRNCTRSLTCKSHSVYLKRKVSGRTAPFDELLTAHKAQKEAEAKMADGCDGQQVVGGAGSILAQRLSLTPDMSQRLSLGPGVVAHSSGMVGNRINWETVTIATMADNRVATMLKPVPAVVKKPVIQQQAPLAGDIFCDENLHYTTDHPKPLAVCTFGGKRIGGLFIADRSRLLARKVMRVAISSTGIHRLPLAGKIADQITVGSPGVKRLGLTPTVRQQTLPYIVNFQGGGGVGTGGGSGARGVGPARVGTVKLATPGGSSHIVVQDAFKTDIQDFKGGIKFELGRKIQQILPSGGTEGPG